MSVPLQQGIVLSILKEMSSLWRSTHVTFHPCNLMYPSGESPNGTPYYVLSRLAIYLCSSNIPYVCYLILALDLHLTPSVSPHHTSSCHFSLCLAPPLSVLLRARTTAARPSHLSSLSLLHGSSSAPTAQAPLICVRVCGDCVRRRSAAPSIS